LIDSLGNNIGAPHSSARSSQRGSLIRSKQSFSSSTSPSTASHDRWRCEHRRSSRSTPPQCHPERNQKLCHPERRWRSRSECQRSRRAPEIPDQRWDPKGSSDDAVELLGRIPLCGLGKDVVRDLSTALPLVSRAATPLKMTVGQSCRGMTCESKRSS
jgi:hypothetical protein